MSVTKNNIFSSEKQETPHQPSQGFRAIGISAVAAAAAQLVRKPQRQELRPLAMPTWLVDAHSA